MTFDSSRVKSLSFIFKTLNWFIWERWWWIWWRVRLYRLVKIYFLLLSFFDHFLLSNILVIYFTVVLIFILLICNIFQFFISFILINFILSDIYFIFSNLSFLILIILLFFFLFWPLWILIDNLYMFLILTNILILILFQVRRFVIRIWIRNHWWSIHIKTAIIRFLTAHSFLLKHLSFLFFCYHQKLSSISLRL